MKTNKRPAELAGHNVRAVTRYPMVAKWKGSYLHGGASPRMLKYECRGFDVEIPAFMVVHEGQEPPSLIWIDVYRNVATTRRTGTSCLTCGEASHVEIDSSSVCDPVVKR